MTCSIWEGDLRVGNSVRWAILRWKSVYTVGVSVWLAWHGRNDELAAKAASKSIYLHQSRKTHMVGDDDQRSIHSRQIAHMFFFHHGVLMRWTYTYLLYRLFTLLQRWWSRIALLLTKMLATVWPYAVLSVLWLSWKNVYIDGGTTVRTTNSLLVSVVKLTIGLLQEHFVRAFGKEKFTMCLRSRGRRAFWATSDVFLVAGLLRGQVLWEGLGGGGICLRCHYLKVSKLW